VNYLEPCHYSSRLLEKLKSLDTENKLDFELINKAIYWARKYHGDQKRKSGEPYYSHPLEVAYMVSDYNLKTDVIVASILHDIIEDTEVSAGMILDNFNERIMQMVNKLTTDNLKEIYNIFCEDEEAALIKLMDRRHNLRTLKFMPQSKAIKKIQDSYDSCFLGMAAEISQTLEVEFLNLLGKKEKKLYFDDSSFFKLPKVI
jgi:guanosine-3',5'-bis(diphosphate) 3'-pyrophosphohydrolase